MLVEDMEHQYKQNKKQKKKEHNEINDKPMWALNMEEFSISASLQI